MDSFVKAAREHFKDENIGTAELFKLMEGGKLLAKDILPLVGKNMAAAAKKGGALEKMLLSNGVAMRRLTQTWQNFQNEFFRGGFGESMTDTFNTLAQMLKDNTGLAHMMGQAFKAVMNNLIYGFTFAYDAAFVFWTEMDEALFSKIPQGMKNWLADNAALLVSITIATGAFKLLLGTLRLIFGLGALGKGLGLAAAATEAGKVLTIFEKMQGFLTGLSALVTRLTGLAVAMSSLNKDGSIFDFSNLAKTIIPGSDITGLNTFSNIMNPSSSILAPFRNQPSMPASSWATAGQQGTMKVEIVTIDSEFGKAIEARIVENDNKNFNMVE
jgi:hypothetical protein